MLATTSVLAVTGVAVGSAGLAVAVDAQNQLNDIKSGSMTLTNVGTTSLVAKGTSPTFELKGLQAGSHIQLTAEEKDVTIATTGVAANPSDADLDMAGFSLLDVLNVAGSVNSRAADDIVSNEGASINARVAVFSGTSGKVITDGGTTLSEYLLLDGTAEMTGDLNLNGNGIVTGGNAVRFGTGAATGTTSSVAVGNGASSALENGSAFGSGATASGLASVALGVSAVSSGTESVAAGNSANASNTGGIAIGKSANSSGLRAIVVGRNGIGSGSESVVVGSGSSATGANSIAMGTGATASNTNSIAIGSSSSSSGGNSIAIGGIASADGAFAIGGGATNATAHSCLIGTTLIANLRPNNTATCDLGTSAANWKDAYLTNLRLKQGANRSAGTGATLVGGTVTVNTTAISTGDIVLVQRTAVGGSPGWESVTSIVNNTSFNIVSSDAGDTSTFSWVIIKQS